MDDAFLDFLDFQEFVERDHIEERRRRRFIERKNPFHYYSDGEFLQRYRLSKESVNELLARIQQHLPDSVNRRGE